MGKFSIVTFMFCSLVIAMAYANSQEQARFQNLCRGTEKATTLQIFIQDVLAGDNQTVWEVARSIITADSPTSFGQVRVLDDLITAGPDKTSEKIGRAQGLITSADLHESALAMNLNFIFTGGQYKGSTLCMLGRNPLDKEKRELAIVGGTGLFRMARGYAITNTYSYDVENSYGVLEYNIYVAYVEASTADQ
ncbi:Dirigent protein 21 [Abeliophyllum distichum]|uniref:Dirigent protein n=1 Tax=Abeliophyllum distichum TaxID=126358 RepID=A0ABD1P836_9LAMI